MCDMTSPQIPHLEYDFSKVYIHMSGSVPLLALGTLTGNTWTTHNDWNVDTLFPVSTFQSLCVVHLLFPVSTFQSLCVVHVLLVSVPSARSGTEPLMSHLV